MKLWMGWKMKVGVGRMRDGMKVGVGRIGWKMKVGWDEG